MKKELVSARLKCDDAVMTATVRHIRRSDYIGNLGRDMCLEYFGDEDDECREHNAKIDAQT